MNDSKLKELNLARIRDNQRRSRARRKEYVQELEAKLRTHEQMGIGASMEIQNAAKKVLDENRRLRALLQTQGITGAEIAAALAPNDQYHGQWPSAAELEALLDRRCLREGFPTDDSNTDAQSDSTLASKATADEPIAPHHHTRPATTQTFSEACSAGTVTSSKVSPSDYPWASLSPTNTSSLPGVKMESIPDSGFQFYQSQNDRWMFSPEIDNTRNTLSYPNSTSCLDAADIIRTIQSDVGPELERDLGCNSPLQDCRVPNPTVFNVMDKYSNQLIGN